MLNFNIIALVSIVCYESLTENVRCGRFTYYPFYLKKIYVTRQFYTNVHKL